MAGDHETCAAGPPNEWLGIPDPLAGRALGCSGDAPAPDPAAVLRMV